MQTSRTMATVIVSLSSLISITQLANADDSANKANKEEDVARYIHFVSVGSPVTKIAFRADEVEPSLSFTPGIGLGSTWKEGAVGVFFYPCITLQNQNKDLLLAPHITVNFLYLLNLGLGYEWQWKENNAGKSAFHSRAPILTIGISVPLKVLGRLKL